MLQQREAVTLRIIGSERQLINAVPENPGIKDRLAVRRVAEVCFCTIFIVGHVHFRLHPRITDPVTKYQIGRQHGFHACVDRICHLIAVICFVAHGNNGGHHFMRPHLRNAVGRQVVIGKLVACNEIILFTELPVGLHREAVLIHHVLGDRIDIHQIRRRIFLACRQHTDGIHHVLVAALQERICSQTYKRFR